MMQAQQTFGPEVDRIQRIALIAGAVGLVLSLVGAFISPTTFFQSYLFSFMLCLGLPLGCTALLMIVHLAGGTWGYMIRRVCEAAALTLPLMALLFVPLLFGITTLYPWAQPNAASNPVLVHRQPFQNWTFFLIRIVIYFVAWGGTGYLLNSLSARQDREGNTPLINTRLRRISSLGLFLYAFGITFAAIDWVMTLDATWFSTIFGMLFIVGQGLASMSFIIIACAYLSRSSELGEVATPKRFNDLGNFLLAFTIFWAYMNLSQFLIIWSGNLPEETPWFVRRSHGGWEYYSTILVVLQFVLPLFTLFLRANKRIVSRLVTLAGFIIFVRALDLFWLVMPETRREGLTVSWLDIVTPIGLLGIWVAAFIWAVKRKPILALHDERDPRRHPDVAPGAGHEPQVSPTAANT